MNNTKHTEAAATVPLATQQGGAATITQVDEPTSANRSFVDDTTVDAIVKMLLAQGLSRDEIVMPGSAKDIILHIADDFDAPLVEFEDNL